MHDDRSDFHDDRSDNGNQQNFGARTGLKVNGFSLRQEGCQAQNNLAYRDERAQQIISEKSIVPRTMTDRTATLTEAITVISKISELVRA